MSSRLSRTIYVGNLPGDIRLREVEDLFYKYGPIVDVDLKVPPRPPSYAFVEFEDYRDAEDAIHGRDGYNFDGYRLRVEFAHRARRHSSPADHYSIYNGSSSSSHGPSRHSDYRVLVTGLPSSASWQDLKDHMRQVGDVCFSQVFRDRGGGMTGIVDYTNYDDMKYAIKKLDDSKFRNAFSRAYIRVREYGSTRSFSRSPSHSPYRSRSRRDYDSRRSYSRSPSRSPYLSRRQRDYDSRRSYSRSPSRSQYMSRSRRSYDSRRSYSRSPIRSPYVSRSQSYSQSHSYGYRSRSKSPGVKYSRPRSVSPARSVSSRSRAGSSPRSFSRSRSRSQSPLASPPRSKRGRIRSKGRSISRSRSRSPSVESDRSRSLDSRDRY